MPPGATSVMPASGTSRKHAFWNRSKPAPKSAPQHRDNVIVIVIVMECVGKNHKLFFSTK